MEINGPKESFLICLNSPARSPSLRGRRGLTQYERKLHYVSTIPPFHYSNWGEAPKFLVELLEFIGLGGLLEFVEFIEFDERIRLDKKLN